MDEQHTDTHEIDEIDATEQWEEDELMAPRPKWPKVVGIFSILYAAFGLTCGGVGLAVTPITAGLMKSALEGDPLPYGLETHAIDYVIGGLGLSLAGLLLFGGITAVTYRPLTRMIHLVYAAGVLPLGIWSYLNQLAKQELNMQWAKEYPDNLIAPGMSGTSPGSTIGEMIGLVLFLLLGIGIPLFYLVWFGLMKTKPEQITGGEEGVY